MPYVEGVAARVFGGRVMAEDYLWSGEDATLGETRLGRAFRDNTGNLLDKWHHYFEVYERHLERFREQPVRVLEIGVQNGGSLQMWRRYLGKEAVLFGIDVDPRCAQLDGHGASVRIGSQADPDFLRRVIAEMGGVDVVIDDGSHRSEDMRTTFDVLYPILSDGGVYLIEDVHACYWTEYGGGYRRSNSFVETMKRVVDDLHHWYHAHRIMIPAAEDRVFGLHFYDSMIVLEKRRIGRPRRSRTGRVASVNKFDQARPGARAAKAQTPQAMPEEK